MFKTAPMNAWEFAPVKLAMLCVGIAIGAQWPEVFGPYIMPIFIIGLAVGIYAAIAWMKK